MSWCVSAFCFVFPTYTVQEYLELNVELFRWLSFCPNESDGGGDCERRAHGSAIKGRNTANISRIEKICIDTILDQHVRTALLMSWSVLNTSLFDVFRSIRFFGLRFCAPSPFFGINWYCLHGSIELIAIFWLNRANHHVFDSIHRASRDAFDSIELIGMLLTSWS